MSLNTMSKHSLNTSRIGDSTTSLGSPFQCLTTLSEKYYFLTSSLNLPWHSLKPFLLVLREVAKHYFFREIKEAKGFDNLGLVCLLGFFCQLAIPQTVVALFSILSLILTLHGVKCCEICQDD